MLNKFLIFKYVRGVGEEIPTRATRHDLNTGELSIVDFINLKRMILFQDHLEAFFGRIRARLGCNTNPTVIQFTAAYKRLYI